MNRNTLLEKEFERVALPVSEVFKLAEPIKAKRFLSIDDLPEGWLKNYVKFAYPLTEAPLQFHIATGLVILSTALGRNVYMQEGATNYYPNLYIVVVGVSGSSKKSTATGMVFKFLNKLEPSIVLGSTGSLEAIQEAFQSNYCHCIVYDELRMITDNEDKSYGKGLVTFLTSIWGGQDEYRVDRKNIPEDKRIIHNPTMNLICATTPEWMQLKEADVLGGFLGRFLPICANESDKRLLPRRQPIDQVMFDSLFNRLKEIRDIKNKVYIWDEEAGKIFDGLYKELDENFRKEKNISQIRPYWSRIDTHIRKLAMIFDIASENPTYTITKDNLTRSYLIMEVITDYYREMLGSLTFSWADKKEQQIVDALKKVAPNGIKHAEIMRNFHLKSKDMEALMNTLQEKEIIEAKDEQLSRKKCKVYYLRTNVANN